MPDRLRARAVFLGAPGAGKGTQARRLCEEAAVVHISTGDMLRQHVAEGTGPGLQAKAFMDQGKLVPDDLIIAMVRERIGRPDAAAAWILDGFPRTLPQAEALDESLAGTPDRSLTHVVYFRVPEGALIRRLAGRRTCPGCGAIWHVEHHPPRREGVCDACGAGLVQRSDDRPEAIGKRLEVYRVQTEPLLGYYRERQLLREVDADRPPDVVYRDVLESMQAK
jgi:adenylate kinase